MNTKENLGAAERIIHTLLTYSDHVVHNRPGIVVRDTTNVVGVRWSPVTHKVEDGEKIVYRLDKAGKRTVPVRVGVLQPDHRVIERGVVVGTYRPAGLFPEVAAWMYRQIAEVWKLDNEFVARWASYAFGQEHRDLKVVLAAFLLVQGRKGDPVLDAGKVAFYDEDFRNVGEAMLLLVRKDGKDLNPKLVLRVRELLVLPEIAAINRELGFGKSARTPFVGRWSKAAEKWLRHREENPRMLEGLVRAGFRTTVMQMARRTGYKPASPKFFETLRWKQVQADDGRRTMVVGTTWSSPDTWEGRSEEEICRTIVAERPSWKVIVSRVPKDVGITRAIMAAAIEAGALGNKDLIIATPTLEDLGLLEVADVRARWEQAVRAAEDMRAANIAKRVKTAEVKEKLELAADVAVQKAVAEVTRGLRVYFMVDISGSMQGAIELAKEYIAKFLQGFPPDRVHVSVFNTTGREVKIPHASGAGVQNAFRGITAGGGTDYGAGVRALASHQPAPDEDVLFVFVGDEQAPDFSAAVRTSGLSPLAFGFLKVVAGAVQPGRGAASDSGTAVRNTAAQLGVPCFMIDQATFADPYAIPRTIRNLIAATPVQAAVRPQAVRVSLVDQILKTELLRRPAWAV